MYVVRTRFSPLGKLMVCLALLSPTWALSASQVLWVNAYGVDSPSCGDRLRACRSLSQAIEKASAGATIEVGPGHYGDLNYDGKFDGPGEEHYDALQGCVVCITKSIRVFSLFGAAVTVIDGNNADATTDTRDWAVVKVLTDRVTFGSKEHGFTVINGSNAGIMASQVDSLRIEGNIALKNFRSGFLIKPRAPVASVIVADNLAIDNGNGFSVGDYGIQLFRNIALGNQTGIAVSANGGMVADNIASANSSEGIYFAGHNATLRSNTVVANPDAGIDIGPANGSTITRNTTTGSQTGVNVGNTFGEAATLRSNNIFGNDFCGLANSSGTTVEATENFWGSAAGPGPRPADKVCDFNYSTTVVKPFSTTELPVYFPR